MLVLKQFAKEIGAPEAMTKDAHCEEKCQEVKQFTNVIRQTLRALEEGTSWDDGAEIHVGFLKEVARKTQRK